MKEPTWKIALLLRSSGSPPLPSLPSENQHSPALFDFPLALSLSLFSVGRALQSDHSYLLLKIVTKFM